MTVLGRTARLLAGAALAWWVGIAMFAPALPMTCRAAAGLIFFATIVRPAIGLLLVAALVPASVLLATPPLRGAELFTWSMLAGWLLRPGYPLFPGRGPRTMTRVAALYAAALVASWLILRMGDAAGVPAPVLPSFLLQAVPPDYLTLSSPEPETWTLLQSLTGIAALIAALGIAERHGRLARMFVATLITSLGILAAATLADVARQWAHAGYEGWFLGRYLHGERVSLHMADLNAAGSLYVLGGIAAAAMAVLDASRRRALWLAALAAILPALWLTGSRSSYLAAVGGLLALAVTQRRWPLTRRQITASAAIVSTVLIVGAATMNWQSDVRGSAGRSADLRSQFLETSARMFASSPLVGIGIGRYFDRSPEFMPASLRELYGSENAHNYFAQQFAELGMVGGLLFLGLVAATMAAAWSAVRKPAAGPEALGLFAGIVSYLLTCGTGHPLLVPAAAIPFWLSCGVLAGDRADARPTPGLRAITALVCVLLGASVAWTGVSYGRTTEMPREQGFHGPETAPDGTGFRWMTRHAVTYLPNGAGFVRLRVHAPDLAIARPLVLQTAIAGRIVDTRVIPAGRWVTYDIATPRPAPSLPFQRVDFRANQVWTQEVALGRRKAQRPIAVMLGEMRWIPLQSVGGSR